MLSRTNCNYGGVTRILLIATVSLSMVAPLVSAQDPNAEITFVVSNSLVKIDTLVTFTCRIKGIDEQTVVNMIKEVSVEGEPQTIPLEQISIMTTINDPYRKLERFNVMRSTDGNDIIYSLIINGVAREDSGAYRCNVPTMDLYAVVSLHVYHIPDSVLFVGRNESEVVELTEFQQQVDLTCLVAHVMPHATITVTVDGRNLTDNDYLVESATNVMCANIGYVGKMCPLYHDYNMTARARYYRPKYTDNGKTLRCTATMRDFEHDAVSTSVVLNVRHGPKVNCTIPLKVSVNDTEVRLQCTVVANPLGDRENRTWIIRSADGKEIRINTPVQTDEFSYKESILDDTRVVTTLVIKRVRVAYFLLNTFRLETINELGQETTPVLLKEFSPDSTGGAQSSTLYTALFWSSLFLMMSSISVYIRY